MFVIVFIMMVGLSQNPPVRENQQKPADHKSEAAKPTPTNTENPAIGDNPNPTDKQGDATHQSKWWPPPVLWDIYWPTLALVIATGVAVCAALKTLDLLNAQIEEMRKTANQTERLIEESIKQSIAAQKSAHAMVNSERAWIDGELVEPFIETDKLAKRIFQQDDPGPEYSLRIINHGRTPARIAVWGINFVLGRNQQLQYVSEAIHILMGPVNKPEILYTFNLHTICKAHWEEMRTVRKSVAMQVEIRYFDLVSGAGNAHKTMFTYMFDIPNGLHRLASDNEYT